MASPGPKRPAGTKQQEPALAERVRSKASKVMMDQQNFEAAGPVSADPAVALAKALGQLPKAPASKPKLNGKTSVESLAQGLGLKLGDQNELTIRRIKRGKNYSFVRANGRPIRHTRTIKRLHSMAVPPAYADVRYSPDPSSHLQAVGREAAGRLQYRYHSDWEKVPEHRKTHRLGRRGPAAPKKRRNVSLHLKADAPTREFALSAVMQFISRATAPPWHESYSQPNATREATTLLKCNA